LLNQIDQGLGIQSARRIAAFQKALRKITLCLVERHDLFFDGSLRHQAIDRDRSILTHAMCAGGCLIFDRGVPPGIQMNHIIGGGQVQPRPAGLKTDEEDFTFARLKGFNGAFTQGADV